MNVNDFDQRIEKCIADDTSVTCCADDIDELCNVLRTEVGNIAEWLRLNKLNLNTDEIEYTVVAHKQQTIHILRPILDHVDRALFESHPRYSDELWSNLPNIKLQYFQWLQTIAKL